MPKYWEQWNKTELLTLPFKQQLTSGDYTNILVVPTRKKLYRGASRTYTALIGCVNYIPTEIICYSEEFKSEHGYGAFGCNNLEEIKLSFAASSKGIISFASSAYMITIPVNLSTCTEFIFTKKKEYNVNYKI